LRRASALDWTCGARRDEFPAPPQPKSRLVDQAPKNQAREETMRASILRSLLTLPLILTGALAQAQDKVADFYRGKTVFLQVGSSPGGIYDIVGRMVSRHIGQYIPGEPRIVVQNVPGGGSLQLANQFAAIAPRDGTMFGVFNNGMPTTPLTDPSAAKFNARAFRYIGSTNREAHILIVWKDAPVRTMEDLFKTELITGATSPGAAPYDFPLLTNTLVGTKFKIVKGYQGGPETKLAMQRGEIHANAGIAWASYKTDYADTIQSKDTRVVAAFGMKKHPELQDVPLLPTGGNDADRQLFELMYARQNYGRVFATPPEVPDDRFAALRDAFVKTMKDKEFLAEAQKSQVEIDPVSSEELTALTNRLYDTPKAVIDRMQSIFAAIK
jgi:tripartite-type tricarboxylate transporter receptor subunit TctC